MALLGRSDPGVYPVDVDYAMRWWNVLTPDQMVATLYGTMATDAPAAAAKKLYAALDPETKKKVNDAAYAINGGYEYQSVGAWWETLDCRLMRIAAGDGKHGRFLVPVLCALPRFRSSEDSGRGGAGARQQGRDGPAGAHRSRSLPAPEPSGVDSRNLGQLWCSCFSGFVAVLGAPHCADVRG